MKLMTKALTSLRGSSKSTTLITIEKLKQKTTKFKHGLMVAMLGASTLAFTGTASATLIDSINLLNPGDKYRVLFVTSTTRNATSTDINDYNTFVQAAADAGSVTMDLGLNWNVLGSTETVNAQTNTSILNSDTVAVTFFNTNGDVVALSGSDLWDGSLNSPIMYSESAAEVRGSVWTGTGSDGSTIGYLGSNFTIAGVSFETNSSWSTDFSTANFIDFHLYGASEQATVASRSVPEPGSSLILLGFAGLLFSRYRKQS